MTSADISAAVFRSGLGSGRNRAAAILTFYGLVNTAAGLLVLWGVIRLSAAADHRTLTWYASLWDPWFLVWGLPAAAALVRGRHGLRQAADDD